MVEKSLNELQYLSFSRFHKVSFDATFKGEYQKLKIGDKVLLFYNGEKMEGYVRSLHYNLTFVNLGEDIVLEEEKYGQILIEVNKEKKEKDYTSDINEYFEYKKLLSDSKNCSYEILSKKIPEDINKTKIVLKYKIINPFLINSVLPVLFKLPKGLLHHLMDLNLFIDTHDGEFISRRAIDDSDPIYLTGIDAIKFIYKRDKIEHPLLKEEDIFINEIYILPDHWEHMYLDDIGYNYRFIVNRNRNLVMLANNEDSPSLIIENEKRMIYKKCRVITEIYKKWP